jgi:hypothetical protein
MNHRNSWVKDGQYLNPDIRQETSEAEFWYRNGWEACKFMGNNMADIDIHILRMLKNSFMLGFEAGSSANNSTFAEQKWEQIKYLFETDIMDLINKPATNQNGG